MKRYAALVRSSGDRTVDGAHVSDLPDAGSAEVWRKATRRPPGYGLAWKVPMPTAREIEPFGDPYRPYRTVVAWYCWRDDETSIARHRRNRIDALGDRAVG